MNKKTKLKNKLIIFFIALAVSTGTSFSIWQNGKADNSIVQVTDTPDETRAKLDELQKRADIYREIIEIKKKQGESLNNQLEIADSNMDEVRAQIDITRQQIDDFNSQITRISAQIREKEKIIAKQKEILTNLMQSFYEINLVNPIVSYLNGSNIASFIVKKDRISQTGDKVGEMVNSVKDIKTDLEKQNKLLDEKKAGFVATNENLNKQNTKLEITKKQKANLLAQTNGEEARYTQLLARVEQQKQELLDIDQFFAASGLSVDSYPKPDSKYFASTSWFFSQRDSRWGNETIGNTKTLMKSYGCAVTAVAMVFKEHGGNVDPGQLSSESIFSGDLINWPINWTAPVVALTSDGKSHGNMNWSVVDEQIAKKNPVIVYIGKTVGKGGHYVVIHTKTKEGKYVVHDPYFGSNIFLDTTRALVGAMGTSSSTMMNQMIIYN
jgi:peptidoglycan hydrolase CwlO-like protein